MPVGPSWTGSPKKPLRNRQLRAVAEKAGWEIVEEFVDHGISGARGRDKRPAFDALCKAATRREIDLVAAWSVDRLGRSLQDLIAFLGELQASGMDLYLHQQGVDTPTPARKALFQMMGVFAEFELAMIRERVMAGLERAKASGKKLGRRPISPEVERAIKKKRAKGLGMDRIARELGVGNVTVQRVVLTMST